MRWASFVAVTLSPASNGNLCVVAESGMKSQTIFVLSVILRPVSKQPFEVVLFSMYGSSHSAIFPPAFRASPALNLPDTSS